MAAVLDASAVLAIVFEERGVELALAAARDGLISAVNWVEVLSKAASREIDAVSVREGIDRLELTLIVFTIAEAELAAALADRAGFKSVSLADRSCLATAMIRRLPVVTADRKWADLDLGIEVRLIR